MTAPDALDDEVVAQTVHAHWALAAAGLSDLVWGHAALRDPAGEGIYLKASGWAFEEIDVDKVVRVSWGGARLAGTGRVHIEVPIHTRIMQARPDVGCVVHSHSSAVNAFASLGVPLRPISHEDVFFADALPRFNTSSDLIRSRELGDDLAHTLGGGKAVLLPQHGLVTAGADAAAAVMFATLLERACRTQLLALAAGGPREWSAADVVTAKLPTVFQPYDAGYQYLVRSGRILHERRS